MGSQGPEILKSSQRRDPGKNRLKAKKDSPLRILVADDHERVRRNVRLILQPLSGVEVCGEAKNGQEAIRRTKELHPDLILLDITMPELDGFSAAKVIRNCAPETAIVFFSLNSGLIQEAKELGAAGYVLKEDAATGLAEAIDAVEHHQTFFPRGDYAPDSIVDPLTGLIGNQRARPRQSG